MSFTEVKDELKSDNSKKNFNKTVIVIMVVLIVLVLFITASFLFSKDTTTTYEPTPAQIEFKNAGVISTDFPEFIKQYNSKTGIQQNKYWETVKGQKVPPLIVLCSPFSEHCERHNPLLMH